MLNICRSLPAASRATSAFSKHRSLSVSILSTRVSHSHNTARLAFRHAPIIKSSRQFSSSSVSSTPSRSSLRSAQLISFSSLVLNRSLYAIAAAAAAAAGSTLLLLQFQPNLLIDDSSAMHAASAIAASAVSQTPASVKALTLHSVASFFGLKGGDDASNATPKGNNAAENTPLTIKPSKDLQQTGTRFSGGCGLPSLTPAVPHTRNKQLSDSQIDHVLSAHSIQHAAPRSGRITHYHTCHYNANPAIEDSYSIALQLPTSPSGQGALFSIHDGHSGPDASAFLRTQLLDYLQYYHAQNWSQTLLHAKPFLDADQHWLQLHILDANLAPGLTGACLNVVHVEGNTVRCANAGDCRAIIGRRVHHSEDSSSNGKSSLQASAALNQHVTGDDARPLMQSNIDLFNASLDEVPHSPFETAMAHRRQSSYQAVELSTDHQIDTNPRERERLLSQHVDEEDVIQRARVKRRLQPTRGFSDGAYKRIEYASQRFGTGTVVKNWRPPYTTCEPEITSHQLTDDDEFMILSTDGLFADMSSQQVVDYVAEWRDKSKQVAVQSFFARSTGGLPSVPVNASQYLIQKALLHASENQIGRRSMHNANMTWVLQLPVEARTTNKRRSVHDDCSAIVVFFQKQQDINANGNNTQQQQQRVISKQEAAKIVNCPAQLQRVITLEKEAQNRNLNSTQQKAKL